MNYSVSGAGTLSAGVYDDIDVSGAVVITGHVECENFDCSGATTIKESLLCTGDLDASGSVKSEGTVQARSMDISGSFRSTGPITATEDMDISGSLHCEGPVKAKTLDISGSIVVDGDIEAEEIDIIGKVKVQGLVNAEEIDMSFYNSSVTAIGGGTITLSPCVSNSRGTLHALFSPKSKEVPGERLTVTESVEGDDIDMTNVTVPTVSGKNVRIGKGCQVDLVQYTDTLDVDADAKIGRVEKV